MNTADRIEIRIGLPENYLREAAEVFYESFQQKMYPIMGSRERGVSFLQRHLNPECAIVAMDEGQLVGIAGLQYEGCHFFSPSISELAHEFGWLCGFMKIVRIRINDIQPHCTESVCPRRFYERQGFVADKIRKCPFPFVFISRVMGFTSAITMIKKIA